MNEAAKKLAEMVVPGHYVPGSPIYQDYVRMVTAQIQAAIDERAKALWEELRTHSL